MVPTELLALQHYENLLNLLEKLEDKHCKPSIALLTGSTPWREAKIIRQARNFQKILYFLFYNITTYYLFWLIVRASNLEISLWSLALTV